MKVIYDAATDTLDLLYSDQAVAESDEVREGIIIDYDRRGKVVSIELLDASGHVGVPRTIVYQAKASQASSP